MKLISFKQFLIISRPIIFPLLFLCFLVALFFSTKIFSVIDILFIVLLTFFLPFFTFSINDLEDVCSDKINSRKKNVLFGKYISNIKEFSNSIYLYNLIVFLLLIIFSIIFYKLVTTIILFILLVLIYFYSAKPLRFKEKLFFDFLSNGLIAFLSFILIYSIYNPVENISLKVLLLSLSISSYHLLAAQIDFVSDNKSNQKTTATIIANKHIIFLICILLNVPLLLVSFSSYFKYLVFINLLIILILYFLPKTNKILLFSIFVFCWLFILLSYIF